MLEMSIQQGGSGFFWAVMHVEGDCFEPAGDRSLVYFSDYEACRRNAIQWCNDNGMPHPRPLPSVKEMAVQDAKLAEMLDLGTPDDEIKVKIGDHTA